MHLGFEAAAAAAPVRPKVPRLEVERVVEVVPASMLVSWKSVLDAPDDDAGLPVAADLLAADGIITVEIEVDE